MTAEGASERDSGSRPAKRGHRAPCFVVWTIASAASCSIRIKAIGDPHIGRVREHPTTITGRFGASTHTPQHTHTLNTLARTASTTTISPS